ncbi:uncharacterized protein TRUGW13939_05783 [Talaromyces rugulosus]|uniref:Uncharacterized protein n=1 Tax=Talaromyces rugulosus TaxID=121627 RepID=A0A7H8QXZ2_TALRU|nr:uncharacterized protein TRUGW13939_05783 [Talaromyces rugulosus]QKX58656.1 hypothetical protein TRUGW13939_05783 [Talaromyces rugulosus]
MHGGYWTRRDDAAKKPHIMLAVKHNVAGDERLLKGDVLVILAALKTRMEWAKLQKHIIIPIMLFSFMGHHVKIIEGYHDGDRPPKPFVRV